MTVRLAAFLLLVSATLSACATAPGERGVDAQAFKTFAIEQITLWNAAGIDPLQAGPGKLAMMAALCGTATSLSTVIDVGAPETPSAILAFCQVVATAAAPAA